MVNSESIYSDNLQSAYTANPPLAHKLEISISQYIWAVKDIEIWETHDHNYAAAKGSGGKPVAKYTLY